MVEYIEREALLEKLRSEYQFEEPLYPENKWFNRGLKYAIKDVKKQPKADISKVFTRLDHIHCPYCGKSKGRVYHLISNPSIINTTLVAWEMGIPSTFICKCDHCDKPFNVSAILHAEIISTETE